MDEELYSCPDSGSSSTLALAKKGHVAYRPNQSPARSPRKGHTFGDLNKPQVLRELTVWRKGPGALWRGSHLGPEATP